MDPDSFKIEAEAIKSEAEADKTITRIGNMADNLTININIETKEGGDTDTVQMIHLKMTVMVHINNLTNQNTISRVPLKISTKIRGNILMEDPVRSSQTKVTEIIIKIITILFNKIHNNQKHQQILTCNFFPAFVLQTSKNTKIPITRNKNTKIHHIPVSRFLTSRPMSCFSGINYQIKEYKIRAFWCWEVTT